MAVNVPTTPWLDAVLTFDGTNLILLLLLAGIVSLVLRWRRSSGEVRQQIKWLAFFFGTSGTLFLAVELLGSAFYPAIWDGWFYFFELLLFWLGMPVVIGVAVFKYRLYDIDVVIRKTLVYSALTVLLALVYFGSVVLLQRLFGALTGVAQSPLAIVVSTLTIAASVHTAAPPHPGLDRPPLLPQEVQRGSRCWPSSPRPSATRPTWTPCLRSWCGSWTRRCSRSMPACGYKATSGAMNVREYLTVLGRALWIVLAANGVLAFAADGVDHAAALPISIKPFCVRSVGNRDVFCGLQGILRDLDHACAFDIPRRCAPDIPTPSKRWVRTVLRSVPAQFWHCHCLSRSLGIYPVLSEFTVLVRYSFVRQHHDFLDVAVRFLRALS